MEEVTAAAKDLKGIYQKAGVKAVRLYIPAVCQMFLGFGAFRLLRNMVSLPVPGLDEGGLLWIKDLTVSDPYFILPMVTALAFHLSIKVGRSIWRRHHYDLRVYSLEAKVEMLKR